jgi:hypothetical protein
MKRGFVFPIRGVECATWGVKIIESTWISRYVGAIARGAKSEGREARFVRKGSTYRIVVSDLRRRPIRFACQDRSEESMDEFFSWLGPKPRPKATQEEITITAL